MTPSPSALMKLLETMRTLKRGILELVEKRLKVIELQVARKFSAIERKAAEYESEMRDMESREAQHREALEMRIESRLQAIERKLGTPTKPGKVKKTVHRTNDRIDYVIEEPL